MSTTADAEYIAIIANNIAYYRRKSGLTQKELGEMIDCSGNYISRLECQDRGVSVTMLIRIAEALNVSCDTLLHKTCRRGNVQNVCALLDDCPEAFIEQVEAMIRIMKNLSSVGQKS